MVRDDDTSANSSAVLHEMSELLGTGLNRNALQALAGLCDDGVNPFALAHGACLEACLITLSQSSASCAPRRTRATPLLKREIESSRRA